MKKFLCVLLMVAVSSMNIAQSNEIDNDLGKIHQLKNKVKDVIVDISKTTGKVKPKTEEEIKPIIMRYASGLENVKKDIPFEYNIVTSINKNQSKSEPNLVLTISVDYKDELSAITWGFNTIFFDSRIEFYSVVDDGKQKTFEDLYNYLTLYEA